MNVMRHRSAPLGAEARYVGRGGGALLAERSPDGSDGRAPGPDAATLLLLDNYDSFTFNLFHRLGELGAKVDVRRNDFAAPERALDSDPEAVVISPGPCDPDGAGISMPLIERASRVCPVLTVCLGHQAIGQVLGGKVLRAPVPMHGKLDLIHHDETGVFEGLPNPFRATRYHSLVVERSSLPSGLRVNAWTADGLIMGLYHEALPVHGVQFHPESIETGDGYALLGNFLAMVAAASTARGARHVEAARASGRAV